MKLIATPTPNTRRTRNTCAPLNCVLKPVNRDAASKRTTLSMP
jgi:hypothetical protein